MRRGLSSAVAPRVAPRGLRIDDQPQRYSLGRWPTYLLDMLTETPVLADLAI
jgi:hypothetical protein